MKTRSHLHLQHPPERPHYWPTPAFAWRMFRMIVVVPVVSIMILGVLAVTLAIASIYGVLTYVFYVLSAVSVVVIVLWAWSFIDLARTVLRDHRLAKIARNESHTST
jgi:hypothetical protein